MEAFCIGLEIYYLLSGVRRTLPFSLIFEEHCKSVSTNMNTIGHGVSNGLCHGDMTIELANKHNQSRYLRPDKHLEPDSPHR